MLIKDVPIADLSQLFLHTVMYYKKRDVWVKIRSFEGQKVKVRNILTGLDVLTVFNDENFSTEVPKLGMVNVLDGVVYTSRIPKRIMKAALCSDNMQIVRPYIDRAVWGGAGVCDYVRDMSQELLDTFSGNYPSFTAAVVKLLKKEAFCVAFDRQFAISEKGNVYYMGFTRPVGNVPNMGFHTTTADIVWAKGMEPLQLVIGENCGKALQASKSAPKQRVVGG